MIDMIYIFKSRSHIKKKVILVQAECEEQAWFIFQKKYSIGLKYCKERFYCRLLNKNFSYERLI